MIDRSGWRPHTIRGSTGCAGVRGSSCSDVLLCAGLLSRSNPTSQCARRQGATADLWPIWRGISIMVTGESHEHTKRGPLQTSTGRTWATCQAFWCTGLLGVLLCSILLVAKALGLG